MRRKAFASLAAGLLALFASSARGQDLGNVGLRTVTAQLAANVTCTGNAQNFITGTTPGFNNLGQSQHQVSATSAAASFLVEIDGIDAVGTIVRISNPAVSFANGTPLAYVAQGTGYQSQIQVSVTCSAGATFSMSYTGSFGGSTPIIAQPGVTPSIVSTLAANVQGVIATGLNGFPVLPVETGVLQPATNASTAAIGVDNSTNTQASFNAAQTGSLTFAFAPAPSKANDLGFVFWDGIFAGGASTGIQGPWTCATGFPACSASTQTSDLAFTTNVSAGQKIIANLGNGAGTAGAVASVALDMSTSTIRQGSSGTGLTSAFGSNTLANSTVLAVMGLHCTAPCTPGVTSVTDSQGLTYSLVNSNIRGSHVNNSWTIGAFVFAAGPTTAAADTITFTLPAGMTIDLDGTVELSAIGPAILNQPLIAPQGDAAGRQVIAPDALGANLFTCPVTLSTNTTTQCQQAPATGRLYVTDFQINTTTAGAAGSTIQLKTGTTANCGAGTANLSAIAYPNTAVGITSVLGIHTPLAVPAGAAVCATQAGGATPGTSVVEIRGFIAP